MYTIRQVISDIRDRLSGLYPERETDSFIRILFYRFMKKSPVEIYLHQDETVSGDMEASIRAAAERLARYEPIQYILEETEFCGLNFRLTPDVLIPRPETEELVDWIVTDYSPEGKGKDLKILDIGTGSGCIAVALACAFKDAEVRMTDISEAALTVACGNAARNKVRIRSTVADILSEDSSEHFPETYFDVIVSNPPYITQSEKRLMQANVLDYEPHQALFPPGEDSLIFYRRIATFGLRHLKENGRLFFEINENHLQETAAIMEKSGYTDITPRKDINDKWRMMSARRASSA
jgi:release factor glutamine methyltransferase